ncbi:MAG: PBP1A family penicillin-binding protein, partial [Acidobacteriota bacterium]|nr:PBP1A family penicillin-binding protein [Acidobacteriota bacterium]
SRFGMGLLIVALGCSAAGAGVLTYYYISFGHMIQRHLTGQIFHNTSSVYSAPGHIFVGESLRENELTGYLLADGYQEGEANGAPGKVLVRNSTVEIRPSPNSYFQGRNAIDVKFSGGEVAAIAQSPSGTSVQSAEIEPELITNLFDSSREKRRVVAYEDLPPVLVHAVLAAEDKRFFEHGPFDIVRVVGAAIYDLGRGYRAQGASTIDMQVARTFFFTTRREWRRKLKETLMALEIDQRFSKPQIFQLYANDIYLGNRGSFAIRGFGEGAQAYFGKDVRQLDLAQSAFLAGIIRAPNHYSTAEHHSDRADEARNRVLTQMLQDGYISAADERAARKETLKFVNGGVSSSTAPYFVDMVKEHLLEKISATDLQDQSYRVYTTLDPDLQRDAAEAVEIGMASIDKVLARRYAIWKRKGLAVAHPQVALVALDPQTGAIRALVGGRDYGESQFNHALASRQPGSVFKPIVYAAAFDNAVEGLQPVVTPTTTVEDVPTTFEFDGKEYTPNNYGEEFFGTVTTRQALLHSLNVATIKVAEMIGYQRVVDMARQLGIKTPILATPAMALGTYDMTPIDVAAVYTAFANGGVRAEPLFIRSVVSSDGSVVESSSPQTRPVLDPRVAYLVTSLMEGVINQGTGAVVREFGFQAPAAGKTGTSHDGWFAGYTSNLECVVWVGFDDDRDIDLTGAQTSAPIWAEFMKRAVQLPQYRDTQQFPPPTGVVEAMIDPQSGQLATPSCAQTQEEYFVAGTEPTQYCQLHGGGVEASAPVSWLEHLFGKGPNPPPPAGQAAPPNPANGSTSAQIPPEAGTQAAQNPPSQPADQQEKKKGIFGKIFGIFGGDNKQQSQDKSK